MKLICRLLGRRVAWEKATRRKKRRIRTSVEILIVENKQGSVGVSYLCGIEWTGWADWAGGGGNK
jgi:hypothetical protein